MCLTDSIGVASLRPTFLQSFFDRLCITLESFYTGSRSNDPTHSLTSAELERHAASVDEMYDDFKRRVCDGRGIEPEVVEQIAGGRVMSGLRAFEIVAPRELIRQVKGLEDEGEEQVQAGDDVEAKSAPRDEVSGADGDALKTATLPVDQETSPFAVPVVEGGAASESPGKAAVVPEAAGLVGSSDASSSSASSTVPAAAAAPVKTDPSSAPDSPEGHAAQALVTASSSELAPERGEVATTGAPPAAQNGAAGMYDYVPGPFGRGLVDGLGGLRDSAIYACQLFVRPCDELTDFPFPALTPRPPL